MTKQNQKTEEKTQEDNQIIENEKNKIVELEESIKRIQADFSNYRRRQEEGRFELIQMAKADFMAKITPVLDNFRRAFEHLDVNDSKISGLKLIEKQLEDILSNEGLSRVDAAGEFNPSIHEAISYEKSAEVPADHIIGEVESGWEFAGRVIKPAKVRVSSGN